MSKPTVLVVAPWAPVPMDAGSRRVWTACRLLSDRYRFVLAALARPMAAAPDADPRQSAAAAAAAIALEARWLPQAFAKIRSIAVPEDPEEAPGEGGWLPRDVRRHRYARMSAELRELIEAERPDLIHVEFDLMSPYVREARAAAPGTPCLLTQHDMGSISLFRSYFREMTGWGRVRLLGDWWRRILFTRETFRLYDGVVVLTQADRRRLARLVPSDRIHVVPTGVDLDHFRRPAPRRRPSSDTLVYVGHYPHFPNEDAVVWFAKEILPIVRRRRPRVRFQIVGSAPTPAVRALAKDDPLIEVTGTVEDVRPYEEAAAVLVAPVRLGQGIKGKLLEAFAAGTPVVATSCANEGVRAAPEREVLIADAPEAFAAQILRLLEDQALWSGVSAAARAFVEREHSWRRRADELAGVYEAVLARRDPRKAALDAAAEGRYPNKSASPSLEKA